MAPRNFTCYYYQPFRSGADNVQYDFEHFINIIDEHDDEVWQIIQDYGHGHQIRINDITFHSNFQPCQLNRPLPYSLYHIIYTRIRTDRPCVVSMDTPTIERLPLENGRNIGETVNILYDPELNIVLMQRNITGVSKNGVEKFLNNLLPETQDRLTFAPLIRSDILQQLCSATVCKELTVRLVDSSDAETQEWARSNPTVGGVVNNSCETNMVRMQYEVTLKPTPRSDSLINMEAFRHLVNSAVDLIFRGKISKLTAKVDSSPQPLNLINASAKECIKIDVPADNFIPDSTIFDEMAYQYSRRREEVRQMLGV